MFLMFIGFNAIDKFYVITIILCFYLLTYKFMITIKIDLCDVCDLSIITIILWLHNFMIIAFIEWYDLSIDIEWYDLSIDVIILWCIDL